ncbi:tripartite tricarboxylate transporter TctB family protein [Neobacillus mesonae]|uniref:tripartite tricarboxylate transporter TctB family protein n=1 Tax=Neobacillus mesonae TaxID=1193713 RepID=UPI0020425BCE|nr:tripartite tricarboxylate transporter TctB family protein [Neobacillus mesonae]MCM3571382.1 tripartite tricarboxylate transporter TctB family protein [Neobacillus mesonae]
MLQRYSDIYSGIFLLLLGIGMYLTTFSFKELTSSKIGPAFMPQIISIFICIVSVFIIVNGFKRLKFLNESKEEQVEKPAYFPVVLSLVLMIGYLILMPSLGFLMTTTLYLFFQMYLLANKSTRKIPVLIIISIVSSVVIYYIFHSLFYVMLPSGILG